MKKNKMMRAASALMVAVLLTTCTISGTFAKYVTSNEGFDSARVAKFGVVLQADGSLYGDKYETGEFSIPTTNTTVTALSVDAFDDGNVVAPGTQNDEGLFFSINGQPEVRTQLDVTINTQNIYLTSGDWGVMVKAPNVTATNFETDKYYVKADDDSSYSEGKYVLSDSFDESATYYTLENAVYLIEDYYPVMYSADLDSPYVNEDSLNNIAFDYAKKLGYEGTKDVTPDEYGRFSYNISKEYDPNFDYSSLEVNNENLTWKWEFDWSDESGNEYEEFDLADTILGNLMVGDDLDGEVVKGYIGGEYIIPEAIYDYSLNTSFELDITVTQID